MFEKFGPGGEGGIRTPGRGLGPYDGLANRCFRPLSHLSGACGGPSIYRYHRAQSRYPALRLYKPIQSSLYRRLRVHGTLCNSKLRRGAAAHAEDANSRTHSVVAGCFGCAFSLRPLGSRAGVRAAAWLILLAPVLFAAVFGALAARAGAVWPPLALLALVYTGVPVLLAWAQRAAR